MRPHPSQNPIPWGLPMLLLGLLGCQSCAKKPPATQAPIQDQAARNQVAPKQAASPPANPKNMVQAKTVQAPQTEVTASRGTAAATRIPSYSGQFARKTGDSWAMLRVGSTRRSVAVFVPKKRAAKPALIIMLHGTNNDARAAIADSGAQALATQEGLVVLSPEARAMPRGDWDHHKKGDRYWQTYPTVSPKTNPDLQLVLAMIAAAQKAYGIDRQRVYLLGFSNGAFFATLAAGALADRVAGFGAFSGGLVGCPKTESCRFKASGVGGLSLCKKLETRPGYCRCVGKPKPIAITAERKMAAAYIAHGSGDETVSVAYSCGLSEALSKAGHAVSLSIWEGGHYWPPNAAQKAWRFLRRQRLTR